MSAITVNFALEGEKLRGWGEELTSLFLKWKSLSGSGNIDPLLLLLLLLLRCGEAKYVPGAYFGLVRKENGIQIFYTVCFRISR